MSMVLLAVFIFVTGCAHEENFPELGKGVASPVDVAVSSDGQYFYVLNADHDRTYNRGSILVLSASGEKLSAVSIPRLARQLVVAGDIMLVTFDRSTSSDDAAVHIYDLRDASSPELRHRGNIDCMPINATIREDFDYFFVSCAQGELFIGNHNDLQLKHVRTYSYPRRALYLDPQRELLYAFPSAINRQRVTDATEEDRYTYTEQGEEHAGADEIPDAWAKAGNYAKRGRAYQYALYDIAAEKQEDFPLRTDKLATELHWLYFPRWQETSSDTSKTYRTNFYDTHPDPDAADSFYLSQRGANDSSSNNIVRATINDKRKLQFKIIYSADDEDELRYPGDIEVRRIDSTKTLLVNSFRGFVNWPRQVFFGISARTLTQPSWQQSCTSQQRDASYYRFAANAGGTVVVSAFYGNRVHFLQLKPGKDFVCTQTVE